MLVRFLAFCQQQREFVAQRPPPELGDATQRFKTSLKQTCFKNGHITDATCQFVQK
jgi:hypothetical protein